AIGIGSSYSVELLGIPFSTHLVVPASWLTTIVVSMSLGLLLRTQSDAESRRWMWRAVVSEPIASDAE
ncbi:MAG: hypothetical protein O3B13_20125, partial [Planctomycetota bacterium]|nr:hypothetical protein [Planctomycetota bacterium]